MANSLVNNFEIPSWAGKPAPGLHLDVTKDGKMVQKLMIDEKKCYFFGRNKQMCDFCIDHASCSRVHSALVWHKHLNRPFLIDLGSTHGTFIGNIRLEHKKPQQVPIDSTIHFGASTRRYVIRERPNTMSLLAGGDDKMGEELEGGLLGLPETETELDNLTEFNTAHNRRITALGDIADSTTNPLKRKRKTIRINFKDEEDIINPEDIDPSIGRFRNMVSSTVIMTKKPRLEGPGPATASMTDTITKRMQSFPYAAPLYADTDLPEGAPGLTSPTSLAFSASKLGLKVPNLAPDVETAEPAPPLPIAPAPPLQVHIPEPVDPLKPRKKKYAKEAWPGKKPTHTLLM